MAMPEKIWAFIGAGFQGSWIESAKPETTEFIRADLVDELVKALEEARETLKISDWGALAKIDAALTRIKGDGK